MYRLLDGTRVLEVSLLAPDSAGQQLSDLGAEVIKVEGPPHGDYVRSIGGLFIDGVSVLHLKWNRGKKSVWIDLKTERGHQLFLELVEKSDVVIDGMRWGALERLGFSFENLKKVNPALVYCSLSGLGTFGPYTRLATHGVFFDAYAGLAPPVFPSDDGIPRIPNRYTSVGMEGAGLYAALAIVAGLASARRTGTGVFVEVAETDVAALWSSHAANALLNNVPLSSGEGIENSVRYSYYETKDGKYVIFQATEGKFWENFCRTIAREDLLQRFPSAPVGDRASGNEVLRRELQAIFHQRSQSELVALFLNDRHFQARELVYTSDSDGTSRHLMGTPIKLADETFTANMAPRIGQDTATVLREVLGLREGEIEEYLAQHPILKNHS